MVFSSINQKPVSSFKLGEVINHIFPLVILGAGGFARETLDVVDAINEVAPTWDMLGFIVDAQYGRAGDLVNDKPILGDFDWLLDHPEVYVVCGVGAPEVRYNMISRLSNRDVHYATLIHPSVIKTRWMSVGIGDVIAAGCVLSNNIIIGHHVHINPTCTIGHDVTVDNFVSFAPGAIISGNVHLQEGAYIGTGANIIEKKTVGAWSVVGAGSTVVKDIPPNTTAVGSPAKVIKERPSGWHLNEN